MMVRMRPTLYVCVAALLVSGCGGTTKTVTSTTTPPAASSPAAASATAASTASTITPPASGATAPASDARKDPITVKGRKGDALTLLGQYATTASGAAKARVKVKVTLNAIRGPFRGFTLAAGHKLIGVDVHVVNLGAKTFSDPLPSGMLILVGGESGKQTNLISGSGSSPCDNPSLKLKQGQAADACVAFDVPKTSKLETFQFATDSGYGDTGLWRLK